MEENILLDYAIFHISSSQNRYDSIICYKGKSEKFTSGSLAPLSLFLPDAKEFKSSLSNGTFKLEINENIRDISWFNKSTLSRFLHTVNLPEMVKSAEAILKEMSQLEETRKFHFSLYSKDQNCLSGLSGGMAQQVNTGNVTSETTKNELLRALDLRLTALNEETVSAFIRSLGSNLSSNEISNLTSFVNHFCSPDLRNLLQTHLNTISPRPNNNTLKNNVSPAKLARTEREISSESEPEESNNNNNNNGSNYSSNDEEEAGETERERSRPLMRAPSPRRSASPMRRVQIGRSGSRRAQAISIKSLTYFPARDRASFDRDMDDASNGSEDEPVKKTEVNVTRLSVKDAISMFECKKDTGGERKSNLGFVGNNNSKPVLTRRWSSGVVKNESKHETEPQNGLISNQNAVSSDSVTEGEKREEAVENEEREREMEGPVECENGEDKSQKSESDDKAMTSAEWNRQKEAELNEMLLKIMGTQPGKYGLTGLKEQKGDFYAQYKDLRDSKLRAGEREKSVKTVKKVQNNNNSNNNNNNKASIVSKKGNVVKEKRISPIPAQRAPRRNSSPQIAPKKEILKSSTPSVVSKKASPRTSPAPSSTLTKSSNNSLKNKSINTSLNVSTNSNTPISRRKPQNTPPITPPLTQPDPKKPERVIKAKKEIRGEIKPVSKGQIENKPKTVSRINNRGTKSQNSPLLEDAKPKPKPSFYNKVSKKSSVVPLESKPNLKKNTVSAKTKLNLNTNIEASPKSSVNSLVQSQDKEEQPVPVIKESVPVPEENKTIPNLDILPNNNELKNEIIDFKSENPETIIQTTNTTIIQTTNTTTITNNISIQQEEEMCIISSDAWVETEEEEQLEAPVIYQNGEEPCEINSSEIEPVQSSSPKIRHSLSQMLQAEILEPEIVEWGNAENPKDALVFQKDSPKGFKRLLKFARKGNSSNNNNGGGNYNKGDDGLNVYSEGEEEVEEVKGNMMNYGGLNAKGRGPLLSESFDGGVMSKRAIDGRRTNSGLSAQSSGSNLNFGNGHVSSAKASRSFFSLSNFRSSKSNETKPR